MFLEIRQVIGSSDLSFEFRKVFAGTVACTTKSVGENAMENHFKRRTRTRNYLWYENHIFEWTDHYPGVKNNLNRNTDRKQRFVAILTERAEQTLVVLTYPFGLKRKTFVIEFGLTFQTESTNARRRHITMQRRKHLLYNSFGIRSVFVKLTNFLLVPSLLVKFENGVKEPLPRFLNIPWSLLWYTIEITSKCSKLRSRVQVESRTAGEWFHYNELRHHHVISRWSVLLSTTAVDQWTRKKSLMVSYCIN